VTARAPNAPIAPRVIQVLGRSAMVPEADLTPETTLSTLGIGSLEWIECVLAFEDEFRLELPDADLRQLRTVQDIVDVVERALRHAEPKRPERRAPR
jgi:acyl carrier protein